MKKISRYFLQGLIYISPITITVYIVYAIIKFTDGLLQNYIEKYLDINIPGLGILTVFVFLTLLGFIGSTVLARPFKAIFRKIINRTPFVKLIYSSINDLMTAFMGKESKFKHPVLVRVSKIQDLEKLGFVTQYDLAELDSPGKVAVYFPHSYNFSGELFIVPKEDVKEIDLPPAEAMKYIISGGISRSTELNGR